MERDTISLLVITLITAGLFYLLNTTTAEPHMTGGNGNLGLMFMIPTIPLYMYLAYLLYKSSKRFFNNQTRRTVSTLVLFSLVALILIMFFEYTYVKTKLTELTNPLYYNDNNKIGKLTLLRPFTNNWYFNGYTFFLFPLLAVIFGGVKRLFYKG